MSNTMKYNKREYAVSLRKRINKPTVWKDLLEIKITDKYDFTRGVITTEGTPATHTRGSAFTYQDMVLAQDTGTISSGKIIPLFIDYADLAQQSYVGKQKVAELQGKLLDEQVESLLYGQHANWTDFGSTDLADGADDDTSQITISVTNIDNIVRQVRRKIRENNGSEFMAEYGIGFSWTASENGISEEKAFKYLGGYHYLTTQQTANHRFAGIRKIGTLGILRSTYGVPFFEEVASGAADGGSANALSGVGIHTRIDYGWEWSGTSNSLKEFWCDINAST
jgi:hypothetical protein